jgi:hypothetical protein
MGRVSNGQSGRKHGGRVTPKRTTPKQSRVPGDGMIPGFANDERLGLARIFAGLLQGARRELGVDADPLTAEVWASRVCGVWYGQQMIGQDVEEIFGGGLVDHASTQRRPEAIRLLRAMAAVMPEPYCRQARAGADRLAAEGLEEPAWATELGTARPSEAWLVFDGVDDDGVTVLVGFDAYGSSHSVGVYVDHNLGGIAKDAFVSGALPEALAVIDATREPGVERTAIGLAEARARIRNALAETDRTWQPPITDDMRNLRALVLARLRNMPKHGTVPSRHTLGEPERESLLEDFCRSKAVLHLARCHPGHAEVIEDLAFHILSYSLDYTEGTPLRFSPVMVEIFCSDWAPRKIVGDEKIFSLVPEVLEAWIRFVGKRRGLPEGRISEAVAAVDKYVDEMLDAAQDPEAWGPAKSLLQAMQERGIDFSNPAAVQAFVDEVNAEGGLASLR